MWKALIALNALAAMAETRPLSIYWIDVEGGAATLIVTPRGESVLLDAGDDLDRDAARIFEIASKHAGLKKIDHVVLSHWHPDHYGGVKWLTQRIAVDHFYHHRIPTSIPEDPDPARFPRMISGYKEAVGDRAVSIGAGFSLPLLTTDSEAVTIRCIAGDKQVVSTHEHLSTNAECNGIVPAAPDRTDNANSLAFLIAYGRFRMFDGGDLTKDIEQKLACPVNLPGTVDIFQTNSHGIDVSNDPRFVRSLRPRVAVVNNGPRKGAEIESMKALRAVPSIETVWQLHENLTGRGAINTAREFIANPQAECQARFLKAEAFPDGSFTMRVEDGKPRRYKARRR